MMFECKPERYPNNEKGVTRMLRELLEQGLFAKVYEMPDVASYESEFSLTRGRADFVVFHVDGSVTVIEAKGPGDMRSTLAGIGQLLSYTIQIGMSRGLKGAVRGILVAPVKVDTDAARLLGLACLRAGMEFLPCPPMSVLNENARNVMEYPRGAAQ